MAETDQMKTIADFWTKTGNEVSAAHQKVFKDFAEGMTKAFVFPMLPFAPGNATIENAGDAFRQRILSSLKISDSTIQGTPQSGSADSMTAELLQKIFDPREWLSATGYMDETVRRLTEGPKFSDLGQIEGKILNLFRALSETRARSLEQSTLVLAAWTKAVSEFAGKLSEAAATKKPFSSRSEIVSLWVEIGNRHLLEAHVELRRQRKDPLGVLEHDVSRGRQSDLAVTALEQARVEPLLELLDLEGHRRLRHEQRVRRLGERQLLCHRVKDLQPPIRHGP